MKKIYSFFKIRIFGFVVFCLFAGINIGIRAQGIIVQGQAQPFINAKLPFQPSAVEPIGDGKYLLVANDKTNDKGRNLVIVDAEKREIVGDLPITNNFTDWEAMAKDSENNYYLITSKAEIISFRLKDETADVPSKIEIESESIPADIKESFNLVKKELNDPSAEVEGLAVLENCNKKELIVGIRRFTSGTVHVYRVDLTGEKKLLIPYFLFDVEKTKEANWHLSSIEYVPDWKGFLIVLSTEKYPDTFYGNVLWFVKETSAGDIGKKTPQTIEVFDDTMKAEGLAVLWSNRAKLEVVIVFDNDSTNILAKIKRATLIKPK